MKTAQDFKARSGAALSWHRGWVVSWVQQTRARLKGRPLPNPRPPRPFLQSACSPASHCQPQLGGLKRAALRGTGILGAPGPQGGREGARRCAGRGRAGPAPAARLSAPPIGPESDDSRAEQEGNRSRARRPRLQAVQLLPPPPRLPVGPLARRPIRSMSGLRVYSTSVTGSREVSARPGVERGWWSCCSGPGAWDPPPERGWRGAGRGLLSWVGAGSAAPS